QRHAVAFPGLDVMLPRLVPRAGLFQKPGQAVLCLGELGMAIDHLALDSDGFGYSFIFQGTGPHDRPSELESLRLGCRRSEARAAGAEPAVVRRWDDKDRQRSDGFTVAGDRLEPAPEIGDDRLGFLGRADWAVDQLAGHRARGPQADPLPLPGLQG